MSLIIYFVLLYYFVLFLVLKVFIEFWRYISRIESVNEVFLILIEIGLLAELDLIGKKCVYPKFFRFVIKFFSELKTRY